MSTMEKLHPHKILLAIDSSEHAYAATKLLKNLKLPQKSEIMAMAVLIPRNASQHAALKSAIAQAEDILASENVTVTTKLVSGYPSDELIEFAKEYLPDLIVLGAKGLRATLGIFLGGVAQHIVEYSNCPVLIVRKGHIGLKNILFCVDGSQSSHIAEEYLTSFAVPEGAVIHVMNVIPPIVSEDMLLQTWPVGMEMVPVIPTEELTESLEKQAEEEKKKGIEIVEEFTKKLENAGYKCESVLKKGDAATEIISYAKENQIDTIVVGSRGLSRLRGWLLGSVSRKIVHYAHCSVLVVKTSETAK